MNGIFGEKGVEEQYFINMSKVNFKQSDYCTFVYSSNMRDDLRN